MGPRLPPPPAALFRCFGGHNFPGWGGAGESCRAWTRLGEDFRCFLLQLIVRVFDRNTNKELDDSLPFSIIMDDMNDNTPTFTGQLQVTVLEKSKAGEEPTPPTPPQQERRSPGPDPS